MQSPMLQKGNSVPSDKEYTQVEAVAVAIPVGPTLPSKEGVDQHGLQVGRWKNGIFSCFDTCIPNGWF